VGEVAHAPRIKVLACATVLEELGPLMPDDMDVAEFDFGLHLHPEGLRDALQAAVDTAAADHDVVVLGYGLCSMAVVGLRANGCTVVVPRVDDCIAAFLGSQEEYRRRTKEEPGTYYLTKGWIEVSDTLLDEYRRLVDAYGDQRAERMMSLMLRHYKRLVFIDTGHVDQERYRRQARAIADRFGLAYQEIPGSQRLLLKLLNGPWDDEFVVAEPGGTIRFDEFRTTATTTANAIVTEVRLGR
jgi:Protein of unknown function (DUF1638)